MNKVSLPVLSETQRHVACRYLAVFDQHYMATLDTVEMLAANHGRDKIFASVVGHVRLSTTPKAMDLDDKVGEMIFATGALTLLRHFLVQRMNDPLGAIPLPNDPKSMLAQIDVPECMAGEGFCPVCGKPRNA